MNTPPKEVNRPPCQPQRFPWWLWLALPFALPVFPAVALGETFTAILTRADRGGEPARRGFDGVTLCALVLTHCGAVVGAAALLFAVTSPFAKELPLLHSPTFLLLGALAWSQLLAGYCSPHGRALSRVVLAGEEVEVRTLWLGYPDQFRLVIVRGLRGAVWQLDYYGRLVVADDAWLGAFYGAEFGKGAGAEVCARPIYPPQERARENCRAVRITTGMAQGPAQLGESLPPGRGAGAA